MTPPLVSKRSERRSKPMYEQSHSPECEEDVKTTITETEPPNAQPSITPQLLSRSEPVPTAKPPISHIESCKNAPTHRKTDQRCGNWCASTNEYHMHHHTHVHYHTHHYHPPHNTSLQNKLDKLGFAVPPHSNDKHDIGAFECALPMAPPMNTPPQQPQLCLETTVADLQKKNRICPMDNCDELDLIGCDSNSEASMMCHCASETDCHSSPDDDIDGKTWLAPKGKHKRRKFKKFCTKHNKPKCDKLSTKDLSRPTAMQRSQSANVGSDETHNSKRSQLISAHLPSVSQSLISAEPNHRMLTRSYTQDRIDENRTLPPNSTLSLSETTSSFSSEIPLPLHMNGPHSARHQPPSLHTTPKSVTLSSDIPLYPSVTLSETRPAPLKTKAVSPKRRQSDTALLRSPMMQHHKRPATLTIPSSVFSKIAKYSDVKHRFQRKHLQPYTWDEIGRHKSKESCWIVCDGLVLDVTKFLPYHPGRSASILRQSGTNCDEHLKMHSPAARKLFFKFIIGRLHGDDNDSNCLIM